MLLLLLFLFLFTTPPVSADDCVCRQLEPLKNIYLTNCVPIPFSGVTNCDLFFSGISADPCGDCHFVLTVDYRPPYPGTGYIMPNPLVIPISPGAPLFTHHNVLLLG